MMFCTGCGGDLDATLGECRICGRQITVKEYIEWHSRIVAPRKKEQDEKLDYAERSVT